MVKPTDFDSVNSCSSQDGASTKNKNSKLVINMNWVVFSVLMGLAIFNLLAIGIFHHSWHIDNPEKSWKCGEFAGWTCMLAVCGICYLIVLGIEKFKMWLDEKKNK